MKRTTGNIYDACGIVEGWIECDNEEEFIESAQLLIDTGLWLQLQGSTGRICNNLIENGKCHLPENRQRDYYGNVVKSRYDQ